MRARRAAAAVSSQPAVLDPTPAGDLASHPTPPQAITPVGAPMAHNLPRPAEQYVISILPPGILTQTELSELLLLWLVLLRWHLLVPGALFSLFIPPPMLILHIPFILRLQLQYENDSIMPSLVTLKRINNEPMRFSSLQIAEDPMLLQHHALLQIVLHLQDALETLLYLPLLQNLRSMSLSNLFSGLILEIQIICHPSQAWNAHPTPSSPKLQALFMADLGERLLLPNTSGRRSLMFGLSWKLQQMRESTVCFASMSMSHYVSCCLLSFIEKNMKLTPNMKWLAFQMLLVYQMSAGICSSTILLTG